MSSSECPRSIDCRLVLEMEDDDDECCLRAFRERIDRVGMELPSVEVRFERLSVEVEVHVGRRALPTLPNFVLNLVEKLLCLSQKKRCSVLHDVSGIVRPRRMTLLLGPPGSGKTSLLRALAGKLDGHVSGTVTYNGHEMHEFVPQRTAAFVSQSDLHLGQLTVRETLEFSARCHGTGHHSQILAELTRREQELGIHPNADADSHIFLNSTALKDPDYERLTTNYVLKTLSLDMCADTLVGDEMKRGISGGQKKRVNTGEMLVGPAKVMFMDEISTGLDSATTFQMVKFLRQSVHALDGTALVSLLQPAPEAFELFDDLILLSEGQIVYQGPRALVVEFFEHMGFRCPERKAVADFLQEVTSRKDQQQYWHEKAAPYRYVSVSEFAQAYPKFHVGESLARDLATPFERSKSHPAALVRERYALSAWSLFWVCTHRERLLMRRNTAYYLFKAAQAATTALIAMSVFFRSTLSPSSVRDGELYLAALYFILIMNMLVVLSEMAVTIQRLPVFYKQRDALFYPAWAYVLPSCLLRLPMSLYESLVWISLTYFTIGFSPDPIQFVRHWLILFMVHQMALSLFRLIGSVARVMTVAFTGGTFAIMVLVVLGGFIIDREHIPRWWIWAYWISPLAYAQNAIAVNEFLSSRWNSPPNPGLHSTASSLGHQVLLTRGFFDKPHWYWLGATALLAYTLLFNLLYCFFLKTLNPLTLNPKTLTTLNFSTPEKEPQPQPQSQSSSLRFSSKSLEHVEEQGVLPLTLNPLTLNPKTLNPKPSHHFTTPEKEPQPQPQSQSSSLRFSSKSLEHVEEQGVLPFTPVSMAFRHINYFIDMPAEMRGGGGERRLQLLDDISGVFRPGVLTALVGVSGAGKTTLMDVLAGRKTSGYTEGEIFLNGYRKKQAAFTRVSGYCEQVEVHSRNVTVHESLVYSAWLRLSNTVAASEAFVEEIMALVELTSARSALVTGLSTEARKRLSIAVELVANPAIIFMDEPTSGLDARAAAVVMRAVRNTVDTGRPVVCTIHQPNVDIFEAFDELMLLNRGGKIIYSGPLGQHSSKLLNYFQSIPGVSPITEPTNPSTWILNVTSATSAPDFVAFYATSSLHQQTEALIMKEITSRTREISFPTKYARPLWEQFLACLWKQQKSYWRNPVYNVVRVVYTTVCGLTLGSVFWKLAVGVSQQQELVDLMGAMYAAVLFMGINYASGVQTVVAEERMVFYRERAAGMYSAVPYAFAQVAIEWPYVFAQSVMYACIVFAMIQFEWTATKFWYFVFFMFMTLLCFTYWGMVAVAVTPNAQFAAVVSFAFYAHWNLFSGFLVPCPDLPVYWVWYYWITPTAWTLNGLITSQLGDVTSTVEINGGVLVTVKAFLKDYFGFHHSFLPYIVLWHIGLVVLFALVFAVCIKIFNFQSR